MQLELKSIIKYIVAVAVVALVVALIFLPYETWMFFSVGLLCGAGAATAAFALMYLLTERASKSGSIGVAFAGIGLKFFVYLGVMAVMTITFGLWAGVGAAAGCFACPAAVIVSGVVVPGIKRRVRKARGMAAKDADADREYIYEEHIRANDGSLRYVFMRGAYLQSDSGGRSYMTHRRLRKLKEIRVKNSTGVKDAYDRDGKDTRRTASHG
jgi:hypothetical protein